MTFLESLTKLANPVMKATGNKKDPLEIMRKKFAIRADETVKEIKAAAEKGRWFTKDKEDGYVICMRNGNQVMTLNGHTHFAVKDAAAALKFLEAAKKASIGGELDEVFKSTAFKKKAKEAEKAPEAEPAK